uniref:GDNF/GAS1 domain-containing protein n=1 Tax=Timema bartmani TaxID=61472 RepID=A0A7R9I7Z0_9NEOP|nr:unnamed protein product [Timema bartmani]
MLGLGAFFIRIFLEFFTTRIAVVSPIITQQCDCVDDFCLDAKRRVEVCRPHVLIAMRNETVVSCRLAQWICAADALCSTALEYYNRFCRSMFHGKKCTHRCNNSISILRRQEKAAKLNTCICDGHEEYDCPRIQTNMARLCFNQEPAVAVIGDMHTNEVKAVSTAGSGTLRVTPKLTWASLLLLWRLLVSPVVLCGNEDSKEGLDPLAQNTSTSNSKTKQYSESITVCTNQSQSPSLTQQVTLNPVSLQAPNHQSRSYTS